jgi:glycerophosphoryl diester phosphodiesterase
MALHPYLDVDGPIAFAHRGGTGDTPENTLAAFQNAVDLGYRYIETDVHLTADGVLVAFHDDQLDRLTDSAGKIDELRWSDIAAARVGGTEPIPRFDELMSAFPDVKVNVEPKSDRAVEPLMAELVRSDAFERVCVGSFSDGRLGRIHSEFGPEVCISAGTREIARLRFASWGLPFRRFRAQCVQVPVRHSGVPVTDRRFVDRAHELGLPVHVWTINDAATMHDLLDLGVDAIMTDELTTLIEVFESRGLPI